MNSRLRIPPRRLLLLSLLLGSGFALSGCVAGMAAGAAGAAARAAMPERPNVSDDRRPAATKACEARAAGLGTVRIIDAAQRPDGRVTVWGTVQDEKQRRSFECRFDGTVKEFKLRAIKTR
jgi:hypothetical protein